jgi:hypothetical protein
MLQKPDSYLELVENSVKAVDIPVIASLNCYSAKWWLDYILRIEKMGAQGIELNIALVPVGGGGGLNAAKAAEVVSLLEPGIVIPMHYRQPGCKLDLDPLSKFIKEMGLGEVEASPSLKITRSSVPTETRVVVLENKSG